MSLLKNAIVYAAVFAAGAGTAYFCGQDRDTNGYQIIRQCDTLYVQENSTGLLAEVDDDFDIRPVPGGAGPEACRRTRSFGDRVDDAYEAMFR